MSMEELIGNSTECNPTIFSVFIHGMLHKMSTWENIVYSLIVFLSSLINILCLIIISKATVFHSNLKWSMFWTAFSYFEFALGKVLIIAFQIIFLEGENKATGGYALIKWSALGHYLFLFTVMSAPIVVVVERTLATLLLFDYEKEPRRYIFLSLFLFQNSFGALLTFLTISNHLRYVAGGILAGTIALGSLLVFLYLHKINKVTLNYVETQNRDVGFGLSVRYQLRENVKTFKMLKTLFLTFTIMVIVMALFKTIPMVMTIEESTKYFFREITDMILHAGPIYVTITLIISVDDYRKVFFGMIGVCYDRPQVVPKSDRRDVDVYFEQFLAAMR